MKYLYIIMSLFYVQFCFSQTEQDSICLPIAPKIKNIGVEEFYRTQFSVMDSLKVKNDTLYLYPITIEPKITLIDTIHTVNKKSGLEKVYINSYEISVNNQKSKISYYKPPNHLDLDFDSIPKFNYDLPYDYLNVINEQKQYWTKKNEVGLDISQNSFTNWSAGGNNSVSGLLKLAFIRNFEKGRHKWNNTMNIRYGLNKQDQREVRKTDDVLRVESTYGYQTSVKSKWYYTVKLTLNTQFSDGYAYPNIETPISRFAAPLYLFSGIGSEYTISDQSLKVYVSPTTLKSTFVFNKTLANTGAFGIQKPIYDDSGNLIKKGKLTKNEVGFLINSSYNKEIYKNILCTSQLILYTDYLKDFGNFDLDWRIQFEMKVNNFLKATIAGHFIYDDNIKNKKVVNGETILEGPKLQIKQFMGIGISYSF